jgi:hypothetical protein
MPRKRLTTKKKTKEYGGDPDAPTAEEWSKMVRYGSFIAYDEDKIQYRFTTGDIALILPYGKQHGIEDWEYWVAKIKEIRTRDGTTDVWVRVQWYYSGEDVSSLVSSFDSSHCGRYERIFSDHMDLVPSLVFDGVTTVVKYNESNLSQVPVGKHQFYYRYILEYKRRTIIPKPRSTCFCDKPYAPEDKSALMHFCPRPSCCRAYHARCLEEKGFFTTGESHRGIALLASSPNSDSPVSLSEISSSQNLPKRSKPNSKRARPQKNPEELLAALPSDLVATAQQPIVKGAGNIAGNILEVINARQIVYDAISGDAEALDNWDANNTNIHTTKQMLPFFCPECGGAI